MKTIVKQVRMLGHFIDILKAIPFDYLNIVSQYYIIAGLVKNLNFVEFQVAFLAEFQATFQVMVDIQDIQVAFLIVFQEMVGKHN